MDASKTAALPRISVIVPAYNAAQTIADCVSSILQDAPDTLELLLIDDGSTDETAAVCNTLSADTRVHILHKPNGGVSSARNAGLSAAAGEYILFVDADDMLRPGLWKALPVALATEPDLIIFGMEHASGATPCPLAPGLYETPRKLGDALEPLLLGSGYLAAPYSKLYRTEVIKSCGLRFDERMQVNEDVLFNLHFLQFCTPIYCLKGVYYYQNDLRVGSLSHKLHDDLLENGQRIRAELVSFLEKCLWPQDEISVLLQHYDVSVCINQFDLLTGCRGTIPFARRKALFAAILARPRARAFLLVRYCKDAHPLLALPYRIGVALRLAGWLAFYTQCKNHFLPCG